MTKGQQTIVAWRTLITTFDCQTCHYGDISDFAAQIGGLVPEAIVMLPRRLRAYMYSNLQHFYHNFNLATKPHAEFRTIVFSSAAVYPLVCWFAGVEQKIECKIFDIWKYKTCANFASD